MNNLQKIYKQDKKRTLMSQEDAAESFLATYQDKTKRLLGDYASLRTAFAIGNDALLDEVDKSKIKDLEEYDNLHRTVVDYGAKINTILSTYQDRLEKIHTIVNEPFATTRAVGTFLLASIVHNAIEEIEKNYEPLQEYARNLSSMREVIEDAHQTPGLQDVMHSSYQQYHETLEEYIEEFSDLTKKSTEDNDTLNIVYDLVLTYKNLREERDLINDGKEDLEDRHKDLRSQLDQLTTTSGELAEDLASKEATINELEHELGQKLGYEVENKGLRKENERLAGELEEIRGKVGKYNGIESDHEALKAEHEVVSARLETAASAAADYRLEKAEVEQKNQSLDERVKRMRGQLEDQSKQSGETITYLQDQLVKAQQRLAQTVPEE